MKKALPEFEIQTADLKDCKKTSMPNDYEAFKKQLGC